MKTGVELIAEERQRQIDKEGWTAEHDDGHYAFELTRAAATYLVNTIEKEVDCGVMGRHVLAAAANALWPWDPNDHKPKRTLKNLIRAGALIAAEIDRIQREKGQQ